MKHKRLLTLLGCVVFAAGGIAGWNWLRSSADLTGDWMPMIDTRQKRQLAVDKEHEWSHCDFIPIRDDPAFRAKLDEIPVRILTSVEPRDLERLRGLLYGQMVTRSTASLKSYFELTGNRIPIIDQRNQDLVAARYQRHLGVPMPEHATPKSVFEQLWSHEYDSDQGARRFQEVCLSAAGALIVIGDVSTPTLPVSLFRPDEQNHFFTWPGAARLGATMMCLSERPIEKVLEDVPRFKQSDVGLVIRSRSGDVWCWVSQWFLDPSDDSWNPRTSIAVCSRRRYEMPL